MDTARYRAFLTAAESGSIKTAADIMGYTSSGISQLIKALEGELNVVLLRRGKKGVSLTSAGEEILPVIRQILLQENKMLQIASDLNGTVSGIINISSYHSLAGAWLPEIMMEFQKDYPQVRINLYEGLQKDIGERLISGRADIAFFNNSMMTGKYDWFPLAKDPMLAVVGNDHPMAKEKKFPVEKFAGERFIMPENGFDYDVMEILGEFGITPDVYVTTFDSNILLEMVRKGLGVSMVNGACLGKSEENVSAIPIEPPRALDMGIAVLSLKDSAPAVKKFVEYSLRILAKK